MSKPSNWPLPAHGVRFFAHPALIRQLATHPLSRHLYPHGVGYYPEARGHEMQRELHDDHLLLYCRAGYGELSAAGARYRVTPGDLVLLPKGMPHAYAAHAEKPWTLYWTHFDGQRANDYLSAIGNADTPVVHIGHPPRLLADLHQLLETADADRPFFALLHSANLLAQILSFIAWQTQQALPRPGGHLAMQALEDYLEAHLHQALSLDDMARVAGLSRYHLIKRFRQATGQTPMQFFIQRRIRAACRLLDTTTEPIGEIAKRLGYDDVYYFSRQFRKVMGISPRNYQQSRKA